MSKKDLFILSGGIGKHICFSSCLNKLDKVNIMSPWSKLFTNHPNVNYSYDLIVNPLYDDVEFLSKFKSVQFVEAYNSYFHLNKTHLVNSFRKIFNIDDSEGIYNEIYFTEHEEKTIQPIVSQLQNK